jgi:hypothetical protein
MYNCERCRKDFKRNPNLYIREEGYSEKRPYCRKCGNILLDRINKGFYSYDTEITSETDFILCVTLDLDDYGDIVWQDWNKTGCRSYYHWHDNEDWRRNHEEIVCGRHV